MPFCDESIQCAEQLFVVRSPLLPVLADGGLWRPWRLRCREYSFVRSRSFLVQGDGHHRGVDVIRKLSAERFAQSWQTADAILICADINGAACSAKTGTADFRHSRRPCRTWPLHTAHRPRIRNCRDSPIQCLASTTDPARRPPLRPAHARVLLRTKLGDAIATRPTTNSSANRNWRTKSTPDIPWVCKII
jgi:hypothetical protein